jgi:antitoxin component YwqK of YwqJK toxin-antitoxin module
MHGPTMVIYEDGATEMIPYDRGQVQGVRKRYSTTDDIHNIVWIDCKNAIYHGYKLTWFANGQLHSMLLYKRNLLNGTQRHWFINGVKKEEYVVSNSKMIGPHLRWDENGTLLT